MTSLVTAYDPAWEALFGEFQLIPNLKPRPGQNPMRSGRRPAHRQSVSGGPAGMIANALLTNQAVVKIVRGGGVTGTGRLGGQLSYITRKGTVEMERGDTGELTQGMDALRGLQSEWAKDWTRMDPRTTNYTYHVIVSYPKDTNREAAKQAARSFAERLTNGEYGDRYKYVLAHHDDTGHPHTHLVINRAGALGRTLQLSRYGITPQDLRELQAETARDVGIVLTATSRFSRNLRPDRESSARIHARRDGRELRERSVQKRRPGFPFFGVGRQQPAAPDQLRTRKAQRNADYVALGNILRSHQAGLDRGIFTTQYPGRAETLGTLATAVLGAAKTLLPDGVLKTEDIDMNAQVDKQLDPARASAIDSEIKAIGSDIRSFIQGMTEKADAMDDEDKRTQTEAAISRVLRDYEPLMDEETRTFFGPRLEWDDEVEVGRDDIDPTRQRRAAERDATDPTRTQPIGREQAGSDGRERADPNDPRGTATKAVLKDADRQVAERFEAMGINGDLVLSRIRNGADVDRQTRENWFERDVRTLANALSLSESQARIDMKAAYKDAAETYRDARGEIRDINHAFAEGRGEDFLQEKIKTGVQNEIQTMKAHGFDRAAIGGRLLEIEDRVEERVTGRAPDRGAAEARPGPERQADDAGDRTFTPAPARLDLKTGVRGQIVATGSALFDKDDEDSQSPYVDLKLDGHDKPYRVWGVDLPDMMNRQDLAVGDTATLAHDGYKVVTVTKRDQKTGEEKNIEAQRRAWKATDIDRAPREADRAQNSGEQLRPNGDALRDPSRPRTPPHIEQGTERVKQIAQTGVIIDAKESLVRPDDPNSKSFYVDMKVDGKEDPQRIWGTALQDQMARNNISIGDKVTFVEAGKEEVTRSRRNPETDEPERVNVTRKAWDVKNIDRQVDRDPEVQERLRRNRADRAKGDRGITR
ncbi:relaxase/mobilization nuclease domain-containing protein [uncultured Ruegeria sp.]|uniref:relaxase/mobilization nuclease domain-containing protein n=1 Tax=uncultured Ruegeria sp. TaxID=259304 RepID=UPI0026249E6A|nr:relaxase/mobilization nuclease domain-containing protein [uncultured Ruegeria sp.]